MKMRHLIAVMILLVFASQIEAQTNIGIGTQTPDASAALDVVSTDQGMLVPRLDSISRKAISLPATGLLVFDSDYNQFWFFDGTKWLPIYSGNKAAWRLDGNKNTNAGTNYIGTNDASDVVFKSNNNEVMRLKTNKRATFNSTVSIAGKYQITGLRNDTIRYTTPSGQNVYLDYRNCIEDTWCCTNGGEMCLMNYSDPALDDLLELSLAGANSTACTLLRNEDDTPRKYYYATDGGNDCQSMNTWCFRLQREGGVSGKVVYPNANLVVICF